MISQYSDPFLQGFCIGKREGTGRNSQHPLKRIGIGNGHLLIALAIDEPLGYIEKCL